MSSYLAEAQKETSQPDKPTTTIESTRSLLDLGLGEVWQYRELLYYLVLRDLKARFKQSWLGIGWVIIKPLVTMLVFTLIFGYFAKFPSDGLPYPLFAYAALLPWTYFSSALSSSVTSLVGNAQLVSKVYFPRLIIPLAAAISPIVDFSISFVILLCMMVWYGFIPGVGILALPLFIFLSMLTSMAVVVWISPLHVKYRDIGNAMPFLVQLWMYLSPIVYPVSMVPEKWRVWYSLNPMVGVVESFRWILLGKENPDFGAMFIGILLVLLLLTFGVVFFKQREQTFADVI